MPRFPAFSRTLLLVVIGAAVILLASPILAMQHFTQHPKLDETAVATATTEVITAPQHSPTALAEPTTAALAVTTATTAADDCHSQTGGSTAAGSRDGATHYVVTDVVNMRAGGGLDCPVLATLPFGESVMVTGAPIERDGITWQQVNQDGETGYIADFALEPPDPAATLSAHIPVLMYHLISEKGGRFAVTPAQLHQQMSWLRDNGYTSLTPSDLIKAIEKGIPLPAKPIMITVDDGYASDVLFAEIVTSYGFRPVFFWPNYAKLTADEMRWLAGLGEACGHTVSHPRLREMGWSAQHDEIAPNKAWIEGILGEPITCFAYPFGAYDQNSTDVVAYSGYQIAFDAWGVHSVVGTLDRYHVSRKEIDGGYDLATFEAVIAKGHQ